MGVGSACENLALSFLQWASGKIVPWFKVTKTLSALRNLFDRGAEISPVPNNALHLTAIPLALHSGR